MNPLPDIPQFVKRERYLKDLEVYRDKPLIKVVVGMRRVGKSVILKMFIDRLLKNDIPASRLIL